MAAYDLTIPVSPTVLTPTFKPLDLLASLRLRSVADTKIFGDRKMDIDFDSAGRVRILTGEFKLDQELKKIIVTVADETSDDPDYGAGVGIIIGQKGIASVIRTFLVEAAQESILFIKTLKDTQAINEPVGDDERIVDIADTSSISIQRDETDPRIWIVRIIVQTLGGGEVTSELLLVEAA